MLLVAAALAASVLVHDGTPVLRAALTERDQSPATEVPRPDLASPDLASLDTQPSVAAVPVPPVPLAAHPVFDPDPAARRSVSDVRWVAPHTKTTLWSGPDADDQEIGSMPQWAPLQITGGAIQGRLPIWDPSERRAGWVQASSVGPIDPLLVGTAYLPPIGHRVAWSGPARVTMYTCIELGGCDATASGLWPEPGMVAVDPTVIPLGSTVWVQGLGTFLAADTGSLVHGAHLDVYSLSYAEAREWGVQERAIFVFAPD
jgi:3D (Asp-Asp-Asp) domain-containing protein